MAPLVKLNPVALRTLLRGPEGPVVKNLMLKSQRIVAAAKVRCPVDTSRLRSSIRYTMMEDSSGVYALVGTDVKYALYVHEGTRPHFPPPAALSRWAARHGFPGPYPVCIGIAAHGTRGTPFLTDALAEVGIT